MVPDRLRPASGRRLTLRRADGGDGTLEGSLDRSGWLYPMPSKPRCIEIRQLCCQAVEPVAAARLVIEQGPLSRAELRRLSREKTDEYFQVMSAAVQELGREQFVARRDELRQAVLRKIVNR